MRIVYEVIKMFFLGITILIWLLYWKGSVLFDATSLATLKQLLLPGYIVLCGVMIGYMLSRGWSHESHDQTNTWLNTFLLGCGLGVVGALIVIFSQ